MLFSWPSMLLLSIVGEVKGEKAESWDREGVTRHVQKKVSRSSSIVAGQSSVEIDSDGHPHNINMVVRETLPGAEVASASVIPHVGVSSDFTTQQHVFLIPVGDGQNTQPDVAGGLAPGESVSIFVYPSCEGLSYQSRSWMLELLYARLTNGTAVIAPVISCGRSVRNYQGAHILWSNVMDPVKTLHHMTMVLAPVPTVDTRSFFSTRQKGLVCHRRCLAAEVNQLVGKFKEVTQKEKLRQATVHVDCEYHQQRQSVSCKKPHYARMPLVDSWRSNWTHFEHLGIPAPSEILCHTSVSSLTATAESHKAGDICFLNSGNVLSQSMRRHPEFAPGCKSAVQGTCEFLFEFTSSYEKKAAAMRQLFFKDEPYIAFQWRIPDNGKSYHHAVRLSASEVAHLVERERNAHGIHRVYIATNAGIEHGEALTLFENLGYMTTGNLTSMMNGTDLDYVSTDILLCRWATVFVTHPKYSVSGLQKTIISGRTSGTVFPQDSGCSNLVHVSTFVLSGIFWFHVL